VEGIPGEEQGWVFVDVGDVRTIGGRLRKIRIWRDKPLRVIAELAGITESYLSLIERGERSLE
jgi:hypothetical protein